MNHGWTYRDRILAAADGSTVLAYYARRYAHSTAAEWRTRLVEGRITRNGRPAAAADALAAGDLLAWRRPPWEEPPVPRAFTVLYEDADLLAVDKPAGLPVLPGGGYVEHTLLHLLRLRTPGTPPVPLHRLGRGTSGVILFARSACARSGLAAAFRDATARASGTVEKRYRALTGPVPDLPDTVDIRTSIGPLPHPALGTVHAASPTGKPAYSRCRILRRGDRDTLWEIDLVTGRPHQIRIHLAAVGCPLLGDPLYAPGGLPRAFAGGRPAVPGDCGYLLHACSLRFAHPRTREFLTITSPPPPALQA